MYEENQVIDLRFGLGPQLGLDLGPIHTQVGIKLFLISFKDTEAVVYE